MATTGPPAATASTRTPEVTWSVESYGRTTTADDWTRAVSVAHVAVVVVEGDRGGHAVVPGLLDAGVAVGLAVGGQDLGVGSAGHEVAGPRAQVAQRAAWRR